jgi:hypothetical protein
MPDLKRRYRKDTVAPGETLARGRDLHRDAGGSISLSEASRHHDADVSRRPIRRSHHRRICPKLGEAVRCTRHDVLCSLVCNHDRRRIGVARGNRRHHGCINDAQPVEADHTQVLIDNS